MGIFVIVGLEISDFKEMLEKITVVTPTKIQVFIGISITHSVPPPQDRCRIFDVEIAVFLTLKDAAILTWKGIREIMRDYSCK